MENPFEFDLGKSDNKIAMKSSRLLDGLGTVSHNHAASVFDSY